MQRTGGVRINLSGLLFCRGVPIKIERDRRNRDKE